MDSPLNLLGQFSVILYPPSSFQDTEQNNALKWLSLKEKRASLVTQLVKNLPAMLETWVRSMVWEDPLENGTATHSSILAWRIPCTV